jgi:glycosyltransferase involved in cell wall biosynthesis
MKYSTSGGSARTVSPVSVCLIAKDEAQRLPRCLSSIVDLVSEAIVVDTGSTDATREVALAHGAKVVAFQWCDDFAAARNESLRHAAGEWVLWVDADEFFDEPNRARLRRLFACLKRGNAAYFMTQRSLHNCGLVGVRVQQVRLFRKQLDIHWQYRVHEQLLPSLRCSGCELLGTDIVIEHVGYQNTAVRRAKVERNLRLLQLDQACRPDDPFIVLNLGLAYFELGRVSESVALLRGTLDRVKPGQE